MREIAFLICFFISSQAVAQSAEYPYLVPNSSSFFVKNTSYINNTKVFAHYMVCCNSFGGHFSTLADAEQNIIMAQALGIDGFALNMGAYSNPSYYAQQVSNMFAAANVLGTGFKLFFSIDDGGYNFPPSDIIRMMQTYAANPAYFQVSAGRPMLSTFSGGGATGSTEPPIATQQAFWTAVLASLRTGAPAVNPYFVPYFGCESATDCPTASTFVTNSVAAWSSITDGMFFFGVGASPTGAGSLTAQNGYYAVALQGISHSFMAGVGNLYWLWNVASAGREYIEYGEGAGIDSMWQSIIGDSPNWIEIGTWNDYNESYSLPIDDIWRYNPFVQSTPQGWYQNHSGYAELMRYYIQWYKTGTQPTISKDGVLYFYRTHSMNAVASNDPRGPVTTTLGTVQDVLYLTVPLTAGATLYVNSGGTQTYYPLSAGLNQVTVPFNPGAQYFVLVRGKTIIATVSGPPIVKTPVWYDYWNATGFVYAN